MAESGKGFKTSVLTTEEQIIVTMEPRDGTDKLDLEKLKGINAAKVEVNGVIRFLLERPKRPLRADVSLSGGENEGGAE